MTSTQDKSPLKRPFLSTYDRSIFYSPIPSSTNQPCKPVHGLVNYPIKLTVSLKDIGLEGLDSSSPDKASKIRRRELQKRQERLQNSEKSNVIKERSLSPPKKAVESPKTSSRLKRFLDISGLKEPIYEGTFYQIKHSNSKPSNTFESESESDTLRNVERPAKPQKCDDEPVPVPEGDIPFEEQIRRDNEGRFVEIE